MTSLNVNVSVVCHIIVNYFNVMISTTLGISPFT